MRDRQAAPSIGRGGIPQTRRRCAQTGISLLIVRSLVIVARKSLAELTRSSSGRKTPPGKYRIDVAIRQTTA
jgi:hypothetical protein